MSQIKLYTPNFKLKVPEFDVATWHDPIEEDLLAIDALIANFVASSQFQGSWKKNTEYAEKDLVFISDPESTHFGGLYKILVAHTTDLSSFDEFLYNHPTYYELQGDLGAREAQQLAKNWATKMDGMVKENDVPVDYSSKYYANQSQISATNSANSATASETSKTASESARDLSQSYKNSAESAKDDAVSAKNSAQSSATSASTSEDHSRIWAEGTDEEVQELGGEHSAKEYSKMLIPIQFAEMPTPSSTYLNRIIQYVGETTEDYTQGYFYKCVEDSSEGTTTYKWENVLSGGGGLDNSVSNCITEIPQDIKLELNNGTLTLKAGSKVYVPNGFESDGTTPKFDEIIISTDLNTETAQNLTWLVFYQNNSIQIREVSNCTSGTTQPSGNWLGFYNTSSNTVSVSNASGVFSSGCSLPIAKITSTNEAISSIDQVFNGFGYIGSTVFALPGVKGLIPNGRNADGSLKNTEFTVNSVLTYTQSYTQNCWFLLDSDNISQIQDTDVLYDEEKNKIIYIGDGSSISKVMFANAKETSGVISNFNPKTTFHAVDYNDGPFVKEASLVECHTVIETYSNGTDWYRLYDDGWVEQGGQVSGAYTDNYHRLITLPIEMSDNLYSVSLTGTANDQSNYNLDTFVLCTFMDGGKSKTQMIVAQSENNASKICIWEVKGYAAQ